MLSFSLKYTLPLFIFNILVLTNIQSQDTVWVQTFDYGSNSRDSMIQFPGGDHNQYEKILLFYSMRCKDGLISTSGDRNKGCGEWDYSCNTNIIDSSGVDSLKALHPNYLIPGITDNYFYYTTSPTYAYRSYLQKNVIVNSQSGIAYNEAGPFDDDRSIPWKGNKALKSYYMYNAAELNGLLTANKVTGIQFNTSGNGKISFLKIRLAITKTDELNTSLIRELDFKEVVNSKITFTSSQKNDVIFHTPFTIPHDGSDNIVIEISYTSDIGEINNLALVASQSSKKNNLSIPSTDQYIEFNGLGYADIPVTGMQQINQQISITFWAKGNAGVLPSNNSVLYAEDNAENRQLNVHLPWSNARIYWDCGSDGTGTDRIDKAAVAAEYEGTWNHWTFTKNTASGSMKIFLNGVLWHSGNGKTKPIKIDHFVLGSDIKNTIPYYGSIDDFAVWNKELSVDEIASLMYQSASDIPELNSNVLAYYDMNEQEGLTIKDKSTLQLTATFSENPYRKNFRGAEVFKEYEQNGIRPDISFITGNFNLSVNDVAVRDSVINAPTKVLPYTVTNGALIAGVPIYYWASGIFPVYDENENVIEEVEVPEEGVLFIEDLTYFTKSPSKNELLSFVTPYGIGLDLGEGGKTWVFDVTDFGSILKNKKRLLMDKGGEWQEDIDIRFAFIKGKPSRNLLSIQPIWPATAYGYTSILNNNHLEPRTHVAGPDVKSMKIRTVATGHGQEGEFISRTHSLNINSGPVEFLWPLWKECADNPVYPQGGTWVYDRAGWCPGAPSDVREYEIMPLVSVGVPFTIDYGINTASGDSRYIVSSHLVKYGEANFINDAAIEEILAPSTNVKNSRINPTCQQPVIILKNNGKNALTSAIIKYGIEGTELSTFLWSGNLSFLQTQKINLPSLAPENWYAGQQFTAYIEKINNSTDEYSKNDRLTQNYVLAPHVMGDLVIVMKTNSMANETKWTLKDQAGNVIRTSKSNLQGFTLYQDTIKGLSGCYQLQFTDAADNGISWWANGDGDGFIRAKGLNSSWHFFQPDFGKELTFNFTTGLINSTEEPLSGRQIKIYPNPSSGLTNLELTGYSGQVKVIVRNQVGQVIGHEYIEDLKSLNYHTIIDLTDQKAGLYHITVQNNSSVSTYKLIKL